MSNQVNHPAQVAICIPSGRTWEADAAIRLVAVAARAVSQGIRTITINEKNSVISFCRNSMAEVALSMGATHIMWVDSDNIPPVDIIKRFLDLDKDIVGGVYCKRVPPYELLGVPMAPVDFTAGGVVPYWLLPGGCIMVKAKVYNSIPKPWYFESIRREGLPFEAFISTLEDHFRSKVPDELIRILGEEDSLQHWLRQEEEENKVKYGDSVNTGEDTNFCLKAHRHGFEIWCDIDSSYGIGHIGEQTIYPGKPEENSGNS